MAAVEIKPSGRVDVQVSQTIDQDEQLKLCLRACQGTSASCLRIRQEVGDGDDKSDLRE